MTGLMQPSVPRPRLRLKPRRNPIRWLRCRLGRHDLGRQMVFHDHNTTWRTVISYCKHCPYIEDVHASRRR